MLYLFLFLTVTFSMYGLFTIKTAKKIRIQNRLGYFLINGQSHQDQETAASKESHSFIKRYIKPFFLDFKRSFKRRMPGEKEAKIEKKLQLAGNPFGMTPVDFRIIQIAFILLFPLLFGGYGFLVSGGEGSILLVLLGLFLGSVIPQLYLKQKTKVRSHLALKELPDVLDLLTVSLEAGLGFDSAVSKVVSKKEGILANEFHRCLEEIRLGKTRREALSGIRDRLDVDPVKSFISSILQAEKLGIGMVQVLRVQSNEVRDQRKQRAEEAAMKAPIKMLFPLVLFIFPSLFIVLLGPAVIQVIDTFKK